MIARGELVRRFEVEVAKYVGAQDGVAVSCGTAALTLALRALRLKEGGEAVLPTYVCRNVLEAVVEAGLVPVLCDVEMDWCMSPALTARVVSSRSAVIVLVHLFGIRIPAEPFRKFGLPVVEDACQSFAPGISGDLTVYSFHATKCLTTSEGGMVVSRDSDLIARMRDLRDGGASPGYRLAAPLSDLSAALGLSQLTRYGDFLHRRRLIADRYFRALESPGVRLPSAIASRSMWYRFPLRVPGPFDELQSSFRRAGVEVRHGVDSLLHWTTSGPTNRTNYPNAERLFEETLSLPIYPSLSASEQQSVVSACTQVLEESA
jgi:UDP-4-amino-4-deoxy-L-arabinose-oxoglutarate aminotransferase